MEYTDDEIRQLYLDPRQGLMGKDAFARRHNIPIRRVEEVLSAVDPYNRNVPSQTRFPRRQVFVRKANHVWDCDLMIKNTEPWKSANDGFIYILCCVDQFSRFAHCRPIKRKTAVDVARAMQDIFISTQKRPYAIYSDRGGEFAGAFGQLLEDYSIEHWFPNTTVKASIVERFNRTLNMRFTRLSDALHTHKWVDHLQDVVYNYNNTVHRTIGMTPTEATKEENREKVFNRLYTEKPMKISEPRKQVGDFVRIPDDSIDIFTRGHHTRWSIAVYEIVEIRRTVPITYALRDLGEPPAKLRRYFYEQELVKVSKPDKYDIEKVLQWRNSRRMPGVRTGPAGPMRRWGLVKWLGYPDDARFNTWVEESAIEDLR